MARTITRHAAARFAERFPQLDIVEEWSRAKRQKTGRNTITKIRKLCRAHVAVTSKNFKGYYYKVSPVNKVVFVVAPPETIITVFGLTDI